jgi:hypothetical protein
MCVHDGQGQPIPTVVSELEHERRELQEAHEEDIVGQEQESI